MTTATPPSALPHNFDDDTMPAPARIEDSARAADKETFSGGQTEVKWKVVAETAGITNASIIGGRLQNEGIPVRVWQESAGQAFGLTVGLLGTGYVAVPVEHEALALEILAIDESEFVDDEETSDFSQKSDV